MATSLALDAVPPNEDAKLCAWCDGQCCRSMPGTYHPADLGQNKEQIYQRLVCLFLNYEAAVEWVDGNSRTTCPRSCVWSDRCFYVRPRIRGVFNIEHRSSGGECQHFTSGRGCALPFSARPFQCRALVPTRDIRCQPTGTACVLREDAEPFALTSAWLPYQRLIRRAIQEAYRWRAPDVTLPGFKSRPRVLSCHTGFWANRREGL